MPSLPEHYVTISASSEARLQVVWSKGPYDFEPYLIDRGSVRRISMDVRAALARLVSRGMKPGTTVSKKPWLAESGDLLNDLAVQGSRLFNSLFLREAGSEGNPEEIKEWLRRENPERLLFRVEDRIHVPWGLMFEGDCKRRSENRPRHAVRAGDAAEEK